MMNSIGYCFLLISDYRLFAAAVGTLALATTHVLFDFFLNSLDCLLSILDSWSLGHETLLHSLHADKHWAISLSCHSHNLVVIIDVVSCELIRHHISLNVNWCSIVTIATVLNTLVVIACPKEGNRAVRYQFAKHVESCMASLILSNIPMFCPCSLTIDPVRIGNDVTSCKYVFITGLKEGIARNATITLHRDRTR